MFDQTKKASYVHNISKFMSLKNDCAVSTQSMLEFDFCYHLEYDPSVISFESQPLNYYYHCNKRRCRYTPDFLVKYDNGNAAYFEVKHSSKIHTSDFKKRFELKRKVALEEYGKPLLLITEKQIRIQPFLSNLKFIRRYSGLQRITTHEENIFKHIQHVNTSSLFDISKHLSLSEEDTIKASLYLIWAGYLYTDIKTNLIDINNIVSFIDD